MFSPYNANASEGFSKWAEEQDQLDTIYMSVMTVHEIEKGFRLLEAKGATAKAAGIRSWLHGLIAGNGDHILSIDNHVALESGRLEAKAISAGYGAGAADAIIAGTASVHNLTIITKNLKHFLPFGVAVKSPDQIAP